MKTNSIFVEKSMLPGRRFNEIHCTPEIWKKRILIVEDNESLAEILSIVLENEGNVEIAENGSEGLSKLSNTYFDVIISDVEMPIMNGIEFYNEAIKSDSNIRKRFIFCTGSSEENHLEFIHKNNLRYMKKPLETKELKQTVHKILHSTPTLHSLIG